MAKRDCNTDDYFTEMQEETQSEDISEEAKGEGLGVTFEEWYVENIKKNQDWTWDYKQSYTYKMMERVWDAGYEEGREDAFAMDTKP